MLNFCCMLWSDGPSSDVAEGPRQNNDLWPDDQFLNIILLNKKKVKWSRYRSGVAQRVGRGIALLSHDRGTRRGVSGQQHAQAALYTRERPGTHFTGGRVGPRAGLDERKISSPPGFDPGPSSPWSVGIPTELPGLQFCLIYRQNLYKSRIIPSLIMCYSLTT